MASSGQINQTDFFDNTGGLNLSDSVFKIRDNQAAGGYNFDYSTTGGIRARLGPSLINSTPDSQLKTLGFGLFNSASGTKAVIRAAGTQIQNLDTTVPTFTALTEDTLAAGSSFLAPGSTQPVCHSQFNNGTSNLLWLAGGGMDLPRAAYSPTKVTKNGVTPPTGVVVPTVNLLAGGVFSATGTYRYAIAYRKASTQSESNAALDVSATIAATTSTVTLNLTGLTGLDTTKIDQILIFRSAVGGALEFTTGDLIAQLASTATSYTDTGTSILTAQNIARAGNTILDNSTLPAGTYNSLTVFKRRLVTAQNSTVYLSELNLSESWPLTNYITIPSAGPITGLAVISFTSPQAQTLEELLIIFKQREVWVITGNDFEDWALKFIDFVGCSNQTSVVSANGFLAWPEFSGVYIWDGTGKPTYCSRPVSSLFAKDGDIDKTKLQFGAGVFLKKERIIFWHLSSKTYGEQKYSLKLDLRLTAPSIEQQLTGRTIDGVLIQDNYAMPIYAALSYLPSDGTDEMVILGDDSGHCYFAYNAYTDGGSDYIFSYKTRPLEMGNPNVEKLFHRVIVWVEEVGTWDLVLDYWPNYTTSSNLVTTKSEPISSNPQQAALWDLALWDMANWDEYNPGKRRLIFNLDPGQYNANQGSSIQLQFRNTGSNQPILIHGFSVFWSELGEISA